MMIPFISLTKSFAKSSFKISLRFLKGDMREEMTLYTDWESEAINALIDSVTFSNPLREAKYQTNSNINPNSGMPSQTIY